MVSKWVIVCGALICANFVLTAQSIVWTATQGGQPLKQLVLTNCPEESATCNTATTATAKPIKIDSGTAMLVVLNASLGSGAAGSWLRVALVNEGSTDCSKASYFGYPTTSAGVTPIYVCVAGVMPSSITRGYYAASVNLTGPFASNALPLFSLPVQLPVIPSGYLQLGTLASVGVYNDYVYNVNVQNGMPDSTLTVYAVLRDSSGKPILNDQNQPVAPQSVVTPSDSWVVVTQLPNANSSTEAFQISLAPALMPSGQPTLYSSVKFTVNQQANKITNAEGESNIFVNANVTLPPLVLSTDVTSINFSYPSGTLSQTIKPYSNGAVIPFAVAATSDDGTGWLSVSSPNGDTQTPLTVSATVGSGRQGGLYTGSVLLTPTDSTIAHARVAVMLQVSISTFQLAGTISDASGACSSGVNVALSGASTVSTVTGSGGTYSFAGLAGGNYVVTPSKSGCSFNPNSLGVNLAGDRLGNNFVGTPAVLNLDYPQNGATGIPVASTLSWSIVPNATSYDVYFGAGTPQPVANVTTAEWPITGATANASYSWRVNAKNGSAVLASSTTWSFTTGNSATSSGLFFIPVTPCHLVDTRPSQANIGPFGPPIMSAGETRTFYPAEGGCPGTPPTAKAYSLNVTVRPTLTLTYLTAWPAGQQMPNVSTLNAFQGGTVSNAAIIPAGSGGGINVFVTDQTHLALDINGYFDNVASGPTTAFYAVPPCRVLDTRNPNGTFGGPTLAAGTSRVFPIASSGCLPSQANPLVYSANVTAVPLGPLDHIELWPANSAQPPSVITLGSPSGAILADAAIVAGGGGSVSAFASDQTNMLFDVNGYFGTPGLAGASLFHPLPPCRVVDTRSPPGPLAGPIMAGGSQRTFPVASSPCGIPPGANAYSLNVTVVPNAVLSFLTLIPTGQTQPQVSTLNDFTGIVLANAAIVPAGQNGSIDVFVTHNTQVIIDINGYFTAQ
jgi:hypothetical protein